jgi:hypothetical protein
METEVCRYMMDNVGFPKLDAMLSILPSEYFYDCLAYTHIEVISIGFCFLASGCFDGMTYSSLFYIFEGSVPKQGLMEQEECYRQSYPERNSETQIQSV